ncbi:MAG: hypothetical protein ACOYXS_09505 [Chloroflexota bacterium]
MPEPVSTRPLLDKLGVRPGARVALVGVADPAFRALLAERTSSVLEGLPRATSDLVFLAADAGPDLAVLGRLRRAIAPDGAIWVVSAKGRSATLRDREVIAAARAAGLVDNKVVAFSGTHTALRLVIPVAERPRARRLIGGK